MLLRIIGIIFVLICVVAYWWLHPSPQIIRRVALPNSSWTIEDRVFGYDCAMCSGYEEIVAKNTATGKKIELLQASEIISEYAAYDDTARKVVIRIASLDRDKIIKKQDIFDGIPVSYIFVPYDARRIDSCTEFWQHKTPDPKDVHWCSDNGYGKTLVHTFTVRNDPQWQAAYQAWMQNPNTPSTIEWCITNSMVYISTNSMGECK